MAKRRNGRRVKVESSWNRRLKVERSERDAERAERNEWSKTAPRLRAKGAFGPYRPGEAWVRDEEVPDGR